VQTFLEEEGSIAEVEAVMRRMEKAASRLS
jgi:hypothetical protein